MVRDIVVIVCLGLFVLLGSILCIVYSKKLQNQDQHVGASLLIVFPTAGIILYAGFLIVSTHSDWLFIFFLASGDFCCLLIMHEVFVSTAPHLLG